MEHISAGTREIQVELESSVRSIMVHLQWMDLGCMLC